MQPNPPPPAPPRPGGSTLAHPAAARTASGLAMVTVVMLVWFAVYNVIDLFVYDWDISWGGVVLVNVLGAAVGAGALLVAAGFTFARRIPGAWTLSALCLVYVLSFLVAAPLLFGTSFAEHWKWIFGFQKSNGVAILLSIVTCLLAAISAAIAASVKTSEPPRP